MIESVKQQLELKRRILTQKQLSQNNFFIGNRGEQIAKKYLLNLNYKILKHNIRIKNTEVDLIVFDKKFDEIVFVEVKTRQNSFFGNPAEAVTRKKLKNMNIVALQYLKFNNFNKDYRFDIISISYLKGDHKLENPQIEHFENISWNI